MVGRLARVMWRPSTRPMSGMRWSMAGGQAIPGIRSLIGSGRCDRSWEYIVEELKRRNPANDNWNHWKEKRRQLD
ncbi:MAG: hypothetical protein OXD45_10885 [Rhodobacteraceae bacterium]|nr:hypothetical protein [Paracoccaceae bacterium]